MCYQAAQEIEGEKVLVFIDRGILDNKGYVSDEEFTEILKGFGLKEEELNDRYDLVMHLVTSAKGEKSLYSFQQCCQI